MITRTLLTTSIFLMMTGVQAASVCEQNTTYHLGAGISDITGPAAEAGMMGYAMIKQQTAGIAQRLWARAFIIESPCNQQRIVFVNTDLGELFQGIKQQVIKRLKAKYGETYTDNNVLITATHTHSGPGAFSTYHLYNITTLGFDRKHFDTIVDGIVNAIERAQTNMTTGQIKMASGELAGINFNRSPDAYLLNPESERAKYSRDTDTEMTLIRLDTEAGKPIGVINWFPIHGTSMNNKNHLISSDNKGYAEYFFEKDYQSDYGPQAFVAAFAQANAGDASPNQLGHEGGAGAEGLKAIESAGMPQYREAKTLFNQAKETVTGGVEYRHVYVDMSRVTIESEYTDGNPQTTCPAAIGVSMLAGTQDGEGFGKQGETCESLNKVLGHFLCDGGVSPCQGVKPIALQTGLKKPYPWTPNILPLQLLKIGNLVIVASPFELTTMTGRRLKEAVAAVFPANEKVHVVISALSNAYSGYVATEQEYQLQRYEGASTHFGPWTQAALQQEYVKLAKSLVSGTAIPSGTEPPDLLGREHNYQPEVAFDDVPPNMHFGDIHQEVRASYLPGETVNAVFWGAHPKNNYHTNDSFLEVQRFVNQHWETIARDRDWETEFTWKREGLSYSLITITWRIPKEVSSGKYRIVHHGDWKSGWSGHITAYTGYSAIFTVNGDGRTDGAKFA